MRLYNFSLCGTVYRCAIHELDAAQAKASGVQPGGVFFAFGLGNRPMTAYCFQPKIDTLQVSLAYFEEKMWHVHSGSPGHRHTVGVAYHVFHLLTFRNVDRFDTAWIDPHSLGLPEHWDKLVLAGGAGPLPGREG